MIPGANILNMALTIIAKQTIVYYESLGRTINAVGQDVTLYNNGKVIVGSFQPIQKNLYEIYGLNLQKNYYNFYTSNNIIDVQRNVSGDQIAYEGQRFQCESNTEWYSLDGWKGILCVHIGDDTADKYVWGFGSIPIENSYQNFGNGNFMSNN